MPPKFPSEAWLKALEARLNSDERYARVARNWEGDLAFVIEPDASGELEAPMVLYVDLWHGKCRGSAMLRDVAEKNPAFVLTATLENYRKVLDGRLDPMQAMLTRKLKVKGGMAYMMRNVPVVLDFVRVCREVGKED